MTLPAAAGHDVTLFDVCFCDSTEGAFANRSRDARRQEIGALFARLPGRELEGDLQCVLGRL